MNKNAKIQDSRAEAEAEKARQAIATELKEGSSELEIHDFFRHHGWKFGFDEFQRRFYAPIYRSPEATQVDMYIYVNEKKEFVRADVQVLYTYF